MMKNIIAIVFLGVLGAAQAQTSKLDSLQKELQKVPVDRDTSHIRQRANLFLNLAYEYNSIYNGTAQYEQARESGRQALYLYQQLKSDRWMTAAYRLISFTYGAQGRFPEAIDTGLISSSLKLV